MALVVLNIFIVCAIRKSYSFRALLAQRGGGNVQTSLTVMCCGVVFLFLLCQTPGLITTAKFTHDLTADSHVELVVPIDDMTRDDGYGTNGSITPSLNEDYVSAEYILVNDHSYAGLNDADRSKMGAESKISLNPSDKLDFWSRFYDISVLFYALNSAVNFVVYCTLSRNFQNLFCQVARPLFPTTGCRGIETTAAAAAVGAAAAATAAAELENAEDDDDDDDGGSTTVETRTRTASERNRKSTDEIPLRTSKASTAKDAEEEVGDEEEEAAARRRREERKERQSQCEGEIEEMETELDSPSKGKLGNARGDEKARKKTMPIEGNVFPEAILVEMPLVVRRGVGGGRGKRAGNKEEWI